MGRNNKQDKSLYDVYLDAISSSDHSHDFLKEHGIDPDALVSEGLRRIKQIQMNIAAERTEAEYQRSKVSVIDKARAEVAKLLSDTSFNLHDFLRSRNLTVSYKNFDEMTPDEVKEVLERHFILTLSNKKEENS